MPPVPNSAPTGSTKSKDSKPPVPPLPHGITTDASSNSQAKRASMSAGALPMSSHSHHKSSSAESSKKSSAKRERVVSNPSSINDKRKNSQKRRAATEYTPGGELHVPPVPSVRGASASTPGFQRSTTLSPDAVHHRTSNSNLSTNGSQSKRASGYFSGTDAGEHSAASSVGEWSSDEDQSDETSSEESDDNHRSLLADLDLADGEGNGGAVTGFAVASSQRNQDFHKIFPSVPEGDYLIDDYGCALQRDILIQGRLYVSENHVCFHANIFGWITDLSVPIFEITSLERKMTAFVIPNAIQITTRRAKYTFASFLARDTTFDVIYNVWRSARTVGSPDGESIISGEGAVQAGGDPGTMANGPTANGSIPARKATRCACGERGEHYTEKAMEIIIPGTPERIYNLMFASGFMKDFLRVDQKLIDLQMADWTPVAPGSKLLTRNMSYIKPLNGSVGPKQTKCEISDEVVHCDFDTYVSTITTTRTPDVPSGGVFSVKTRTCIMWASAASTKVIVTTQVEWTGRSFIKGIIERSCIEGQKTYHNELDKAMRAYIQQHQSEFIPEGIDPALAEPTATAADAAPLTPLSPTSPEGKQREKERNERAKQWAYDTFAGAARVAKDSTSGALDLIADAWDQSSSTTILWFVIVILVFSNLATLFGGQNI
ncbi:hypothetical protein DL96DRAFT_110451 [Flagelloscypha sp. PMI_526]|nr:hypothetical protein DL96DRAFT_110451 [Flagelloscypha sp. PMI_526]